ncbi:acetylglutamate kinase [candidate division KSB1 bacterium]|nr:acetylglutamate kinase [candidate division KSB1 bacterium]
MTKKRIVLKIGGRAFENEAGFQSLAQSQKKARHVEFIIVHGGGVEISLALKSANRETVFVDGLRVTTAEDIEIVEQVLSGTINERIATYLATNGVACQRMSGKTDSLFLVEPLKRNGRYLGFVGRIKSVNAKPVLECLQDNQVPIISPISGDETGNSYNVNADSAAAAIAIAAECTDLVYFTDVPGVKVGESILQQINLKEAQQLITSGIIKDGMIAKLESAFEALRGNVPKVHITSWHGENTLSDIIDQKADSGTTIYL